MNLKADNVILSLTDLSIREKSLWVTLQSPRSLSFQVLQAVTASPQRDVKDMPNPDVSVLAVDIPHGTWNIAVVFTPDGEDAIDDLAKDVVPLDDWSLASHTSGA